MEQRATSPQRQVELLEALLRLPAGDLKATLDHVANLMAEATDGDKIDAFLYDAARDSLVAVGTSTQPLSALQKQLGLDVLQISNGGRVVHVFKTGQTFVTGRLDLDEEELLGVKQGLKIKSQLGVPLEIGGRRRGMIMIASLKPDFFTADDARFAESAAQWIGIVAHRAELAEQIGRNAAEQARRAAAEELVTVLAHDLRNFLGPLTLRLDILRMQRGPQGAEDVEAARRIVKRLEALVSDLLDVARIDQGVFQFKPEMVDVRALVADVVKVLDCAQHPIRLRVEDGEGILVAADPARLRQCLENLIVNATQQSPASVPVCIFVRRARGASQEARVNIEVVDEGPGIAPDFLPHLFERFTTRERGGLGLGLYIAKRIATAHGGDLSVESQPGKGARFILGLRAEGK
ncbi:MAG TPA: GAF domain-containing sensor histidine kinase [Burkholderiales bacterium]